MIVASPKPITELKNLIARHGKVLFVGCGTCVTVCLAGGEREVGIASYAVRMARKIEGQPDDTVQPHPFEGVAECRRSGFRRQATPPAPACQPPSDLRFQAIAPDAMAGP
jgi:ferredoxin